MGTTQDGLAEKIGVSRSTIATIERKKKTMTWNTFLSLVDCMFCLKCGEAIPDGSSVCLHCGANLAEEEKEQAIVNASAF